MIAALSFTTGEINEDFRLIAESIRVEVALYSCLAVSTPLSLSAG